MTPAEQHRREVARIARSAAVARIIAAVENPGRSPLTHQAAVAELGHQWPVLAGALAALLREQGRPVPAAWMGLR